MHNMRKCRKRAISVYSLNVMEHTGTIVGHDHIIPPDTTVVIAQSNKMEQVDENRSAQKLRHWLKDDYTGNDASTARTNSAQ